MARTTLRLIGAALLTLAGDGAFAAPRLDYYRLVPGFQAEDIGDNGFARGTGFAMPNRWGQYTAYLMATNRKGQRTWRIEHYLPNIGRGTAQGSTMYLVEGSRRALLIDTANPAEAVEGVNDLKTVVRHLLGHANDGRAIAHPLDFVVANTHSHGDHTGENARMSDRTVYYMDGDWPSSAPANYVPIREGGGPTRNGPGQATAAIDLGGRLLKAIDVPPHTSGSVAYLDADNLMFFTGDALGSAWPFLQRGPMVTYAQTMRHVDEVTRALPGLAVLPAHFYQIKAYGRTAGPLGRAYILDQMALADGLIAGTIEGEPHTSSREAYWARLGSAQAVYQLTTLGAPLPANYHAVRIPGDYRRAWTASAVDHSINHVIDRPLQLYLIWDDAAREALFLLKGSASSLLIGTGGGTPGLGVLVSRLNGAAPLDVALLDDSPAQTGGLGQLSPRRVFAAAPISGPAPATLLREGETIDLGLNQSGAPLRLEARRIAAPLAALSLLEPGTRMLFASSRLGAPGKPLRIGKVAPFEEAVLRWSAQVSGRFDALYLASSPQWYLGAEYLANLRTALERSHPPRGGRKAEPGSEPGTQRVTVQGDPGSAAVVEAPASP